MARANPPPHTRLPPSIQQNRELASVLDEMNFNMFLLWQKLGGGADFVNEALTATYEFDDLAGIVDALLPKKPDIKVTAADYTTIGEQTVICTDALTVTLNAEPKDREQVKVIISNDDVTVSGNGKLIKLKPD